MNEEEVHYIHHHKDMCQNVKMILTNVCSALFFLNHLKSHWEAKGMGAYVLFIYFITQREKS